MSYDNFLKEFKAYFTDLELNDFHEKRLKEMWYKHKNIHIMKEFVDNVIYKDRIIYLDHNGEIIRRSTDMANNLSPDEVIDSVCHVWGLSNKKLMNKERTGFYPDCRAMIMMILKEYGYNLKAIGQILGGFDHSTIIHGLKKSFDRLDTNTEPFTSNWHKWRIENTHYQQKKTA